MPRVLILHVSVGTGHKRAAEALAKVFEQKQLAEVRVEDALDHTPKLFRMAYARSYLELTDRAPLVWGAFYSQTNADPDLAEITNNLRKLVESIGTNGLKEVLRNFLPDVIICTHFLPMELLTRLKRSARLPQPVYCVVTDFAAHTFWTYAEMDGYFVSDEQTRELLTLRGVPNASITVTGIPVDPSVAIPKDAAELRRQHTIAPDSRLILLFGGGVSNEHVRIIISGIMRSAVRATLVVVAGRNATLVESLRGIASTNAIELRVLGYVNYVDDLVAMSDLVITKAGGLIISEVLARHVPLIVIDPIPGQEEWNADFVVSSGAGVQLRMPESVPAAVQRLLQNTHVLDEMRDNAAAVAHPHAADTIAERIVADLTRRQPG